MNPAPFHLHLNCDTDWQMKKPHFHADVEILLSLSASGEFFIEQELYPIREGSLFLFSEATIHKSIAEKQYRRYVLHVSPETLRSFSTRNSDILGFVRKVPVRCIHLEKTAAQDLAAKMEHLAALDTARDTAFCSDIRRTLCLADAILQVVTLFANGAEPEARLETAAMQQVAPILKFVNANLEEDITLDILSKTLFISKYYLCHVFKAATGLSVMEYVINSRILKAQELLRAGTRVQSAGIRTGFRNTTHFIRTFRALTGLSPKQYAKKYLDLST